MKAKSKWNYNAAIVLPLEELTSYYFGCHLHPNDCYFFRNRDRLFIAYQMDLLGLDEWCFDLNWIGC